MSLNMPAEFAFDKIKGLDKWPLMFPQDKMSLELQINQAPMPPPSFPLPWPLTCFSRAGVRNRASGHRLGQHVCRRQGVRSACQQLLFCSCPVAVASFCDCSRLMRLTAMALLRFVGGPKQPNLLHNHDERGAPAADGHQVLSL